MDIQPFELDLVDHYLRFIISKPIRVPTACWLFSDLLGWVDSKVRQVLYKLQEDRRIRIDNGGWIYTEEITKL